MGIDSLTVDKLAISWTLNNSVTITLTIIAENKGNASDYEIRCAVG